MEPALWVSKTGLDAQNTNVSVIANNLANVSTISFKQGRAVFEDLLYQNIRQPGAASSQNTTIPSGLMLGTGVSLVATQKNFEQGSLLNTEGQLDVAIQGRGFFQVLLPDGTAAYTRAGNFQLDSSGQLVTPNGYVLQPAITIPTGVQSITIGNDGTVSVQQQGTTAATTVGNITTNDFINSAGLQPIGENLYLETTSSGTATNGTPGTNGLGTLRQGSLESSNVNVVEELVSMIEAQRAYEMNAKSIETVDQMLQFVTQTL
jgi:flagellar basal-body rod protein FlgG